MPHLHELQINQNFKLQKKPVRPNTKYTKTLNRTIAVLEESRFQPFLSPFLVCNLRKKKRKSDFKGKTFQVSITRQEGMIKQLPVHEMHFFSILQNTERKRQL